MEIEPHDDSDDSINVESKVMLALSRLQKEGKRCKKRNKYEVSCKKLVEFLKSNYSWLDGDIESQVITALLSCVKNGTVCALKNGNYRLIGPNSKAMVTNCLARTSHGSNCCCFTMLKCLFKAPPNTCCFLRKGEPPLKSPKQTIKRLISPKPRPASRQTIKKSAPKSQCQIKCALVADNIFEANRTAITVTEGSPKTKCNYCSDVHSPSKFRRMCMNCHTSGQINIIPYDKFSPRDEVALNIS